MVGGGPGEGDRVGCGDRNGDSSGDEGGDGAGDENGDRGDVGGVIGKLLDGSNNPGIRGRLVDFFFGFSVVVITQCSYSIATYLVVVVVLVQLLLSLLL